MSGFYKYSLIVLVFLFGALMFAAGNLLPSDFYSQLEPTAKKWLGGKPAKPVKLAATAASDDKPPISKEPAGTVGKSQNSDDPSKVIPYESLLLVQSVMEVDDAVLSLQVGLYREEENAADVLALLAQYDFVGEFVLVEDTQKTRWHLLFSGKYSGSGSAEAAAYRLLSLTGIRAQLVRYPVVPK